MEMGCTIMPLPRPVVNMIAFMIIVSIPPRGSRSWTTEGPKHRLPIVGEREIECGSVGMGKGSK